MVAVVNPLDGCDFDSMRVSARLVHHTNVSWGQGLLSQELPASARVGEVQVNVDRYGGSEGDVSAR